MKNFFKTILEIIEILMDIGKLQDFFLEVNRKTR